MKYLLFTLNAIVAGGILVSQQPAFSETSIFLTQGSSPAKLQQTTSVSLNKEISSALPSVITPSFVWSDGYNDNQHLAQSSQGVVEGTILFPSDYKPALRLCAQSTSNAYLMTCIDSPASQASFSMTLDPGDYYFFSYLDESNSQGRRGFFYFHTIGGYRAGGSVEPKVVTVRSVQTIRDVVVNEPNTCSEYSQYCITPPSASASSAQPTSSRSATTSTLRPGAYYRGGYVSIYEHNGQFCYSGFSRNGTLTASITEDPEQPNTYLFDGAEDSRARIFQVDANTLSYGGGEYEKINDAQPFNQLGDAMQTCLTSAEPYYESEEHTGRQRPSQNR